jgi:hypothetical protein
MSEQMEPISKEEMLSAIRAERKSLEGTLAQLSPGQMLQPGVEGVWSVKDILAHIVAWEQRMIRWVREAVRGEVPQMLPPGMTWDDIDEWNEQIYEENRDLALEEVLAALQRSHQEALDVVESTTEEDLVDPTRFDWREGRPLWPIVAANTWWHYKEHNESIRAWLGGEAA